MNIRQIIKEEINDFDWTSSVSDNEYKPRVGDEVECIGGFTNDRFVVSDWDDIEEVRSSGYGGSVYRVGKRFIIGEVATRDGFYVLFPVGSYEGVFSWAVKVIKLSE